MKILIAGLHGIVGSAAARAACAVVAHDPNPLNNEPKVLFE